MNKLILTASQTSCISVTLKGYSQMGRHEVLTLGRVGSIPTAPANSLVV